ncbi:hypothetical protein [Candidatus Rariloculus sp.]|uniref:hypothetical protein n=1 Tax=Candidatus Rariloculus sp. TaxID=3101265 RepID=UPI003D0D67D6
MSNDNVASFTALAAVSDPLTNLLRMGARRLIEAAASAQFEQYLTVFAEERLPDPRHELRV